MGVERRVAVLVEADAAARAFQVRGRDGLPDLVSIQAAGPTDGIDGHQRRVVRLGMNEVRGLVVLGPDLFHELAGHGQVAAGGRAEVGRVVGPLDGVATQLDVLGMGSAVRAEDRQRDPHLLHLLGDQRPLVITRPVEDGVGVGAPDLRELGRVVDVAAGVLLVGDDLHPVALGPLDEGREAALAEVVVDVDGGDPFHLGEFLVQEVGEVAGQLGVGHRRPEDPGVALQGNAGRGARHDDLGHFLLLGHLGHRHAGGAADPAERQTTSSAVTNRFTMLTACSGLPASSP